jgi:hypothetical protein
MATSNTSIQPRTLKFSHSDPWSSAQIIESELEFTDPLKTLLDFGNENKVTLEIEIKGECSWTEECLIDEIFLQLARTKEIVKHNGKFITICKYYSQAFRLRRWIPIAKPAPEYIVNMSDLIPTRIIAELKALDKDGSQYVLKLAVGRIFENIDPRQYHLSIARNLEVVLKP